MDNYFILNTNISGIFKSAFLLRHGPKKGNIYYLLFLDKFSLKYRKNILPLYPVLKNNPIVSTNK